MARKRTENTASPDEKVVDEAFFRKYQTMPEDTKKKIRKILDEPAPAPRSIVPELDPTLDDMRAVLAQVRSATQVATAVGAAVTAGVRAWRDTTAQRAERADAPTEIPQQERTP